MQVKSLSYVLYVLRWMVLAIPGAWFLVQVQHVVENTYLAMVISQGLLGAAVYFVDKRIFKVNNWELGEVSKAVAAREALLQAIAALDGGRKENSEMGLIEVTLRTENERLKQRARELEEENRRLRAALISAGASLAIARNGLAEPPMLEHVDKYTKQALEEINTALDGGGKEVKQID